MAKKEERFEVVFVDDSQLKDAGVRQILVEKARKYGQIMGQGHRIYYQITTSREMPATRTAHQIKIEYDTAEGRSLIPQPLRPAVSRGD